ncbi:SDR family oxidoreductase [Simkania sp.]|uniref:SDR family oxidoreductase n=1 Tax=Simkania sp. TaxID=34094 RepID=UPI003B516E16
MRILLTGANGYIGTRLLAFLLKEGHEVVALARRPNSVRIPEGFEKQVTVLAADLLDKKSLEIVPKDIDAAYYLVHSMARKYDDFEHLDQKAAQYFVEMLNTTNCKQVIYLTGLISGDSLSKHLRSRLEVETILKTANCPLTSLRAGIIIGSGSASFEIIRDLVEKLPIMVTPKWVLSRCQPIAVRDVIDYLIKVLGHKDCLGQTFDIGGPDVLTYEDMLLGYARIRKLVRLILPIPVLTPRLSSYWLILITSTNYFLARSLIESVKNDAICTENRIHSIIPKKCMNYQEGLKQALDKIAADQVLSTWKDSWTSSDLGELTAHDVEVPKHGCLSMGVSTPFRAHPEEVFERVQQLGDKKGWCYMNWAWRYRGFFDRAIGGVGMRKGRRSQKELKPGDVVDFWRVLHVDKKKYRLVLLAEMKVPGDAWLEFKIEQTEKGYALVQTAIFRPKGVLGRIYWYIFYPVHLIMFPGMSRKLIKGLT